jgi:hypothetical protein
LPAGMLKEKASVLPVDPGDGEFLQGAEFRHGEAPMRAAG